LRYVSPIPPLEPCVRLSSHTAHERGTFIGSFWFVTSTDFTVVSLRCGGYLCTPSLPSSSGPSPSVLVLVCTVFPCADYYALSDFPGRHWTFIRLSPSYFHRPCHPSWDLPCSANRTHSRHFRWRVLLALTALCGSPTLTQGKSG
jgi:hypothetical protein